MHTCPECGSACYCNDDIDDIELEGGQDSCIHYKTVECEAATSSDAPYEPEE